MSSSFLKVSPNQTLKEALKYMNEGQQNCVIVVDAEDCLEGILTSGDIKRFLFKNSGGCSNSDSSLVDVCTVKLNYATLSIS